MYPTLGVRLLLKLPFPESTAIIRIFTTKCLPHFLCFLLISLFMRTSGSYRLHDTETEEYADTLNTGNQPSNPAGLSIDELSRYESPPTFFRDLYNFLQSEKSVCENGVDFVAEPSQSISNVENDTYVRFLMNDEKFSSRQQFYLVFTQNQPVGANPHPNGTTHNEDWERSEELVVEAVDEGSFTNDFSARGKYVEQAGFHKGKYQVFNATEIISYARAGNGSQLVIKASVHLGNYSVDVKNLIVTTPGNASPLLVAFDNPHLASYLRFLTQNRGQPIEGYGHPPNSDNDGITTPVERPKRETSDDCRLHDWYVSFNDIHWRELVYVPAGYNAKFCRGSCHSGYPLRALNASWPVSNHALLRSLFRHQMRQSNFSGPHKLPPHSCCVPIQFEPLTMLYLEMSEPTSYYVLKSVPDMVATKCGCA